MPTSLTLTSVTAGTVTLSPISPPGSVNSIYGQAVYGVNAYGSNGTTGLSLTAVTPGSLTLTPVT